MSPKNKKKDKQKPRKPKIDLMAGAPRPKPIALTGPRYFIQHAREYPILGCWVMKNWKESGITPVLVARQQDPERVIFASYLVDLYLLGVKDTFYNADFSLKRFNQNLPDMLRDEPLEIDAGLAHELVYGSIEFAARYGFQPHPDFKLASQVLDPPEMHPRTHGVDFGKDGKPLFVAGPYDNTQAILNKLRKTAGEGNYHFMTPLNAPDDFGDLYLEDINPDDEEDEEYEEGEISG